MVELHSSANGELMEPAPLPAKYASAHEPITAMLRTRCTTHKALVPDVFDFKGAVVHTHGKMVLGNGGPAASLLVLVLVHSNLRHEMEPSRVVPRLGQFVTSRPRMGSSVLYKTTDYHDSPFSSSCSCSCSE